MKGLEILWILQVPRENVNVYKSLYQNNFFKPKC